MPLDSFTFFACLFLPGLLLGFLLALRGLSLCGFCALFGPFCFAFASRLETAEHGLQLPDDDANDLFQRPSFSFSPFSLPL